MIAKGLAANSGNFVFKFHSANHLAWKPAATIYYEEVTRQKIKEETTPQNKFINESEEHIS